MLSINCAYTAPINPSGAQPVLSRAQVWKGLQRKIRRAQDFVPIIRACEVLEEREDEVVRMAYFHRRQQEDKGGEEGEGKGKETGQTTGGGGGGVREVCRSYPMTKVGFLYFLFDFDFWVGKNMSKRRRKEGSGRGDRIPSFFPEALSFSLSPPLPLCDDHPTMTSTPNAPKDY